MEHSKHLRLLTLFNEDYVKMITASNENLAGKAKASNKPKEAASQKKKFTVKKLKKLVSPKNHGILSPSQVSHATPSLAFENGINLFRKQVPGKVSKKKKVETTVVSVSPLERNEEDAEVKAVSVQNGDKDATKNWINRGLWWWEPPEEHLPLDFCRDTSLHGLKYIGQSQRHMSERIFWFVAFFSGLCLAFYLISDVWIKYNTSPIIVSFRSVETSVNQIPFPAVTICNMNKVLKSKADEYLRPDGDPEKAYYVNHVCSTTKSFSKRFNYTEESLKIDPDVEGNPSSDQVKWTKVNEFLRKAAQNCTDMIPLCMWQDTIFNCTELFRPIETEYGKCCVFNMVPLSLLYTLRNDERDNEKEIYQWERWNIDVDGFLLEENYQYDYPRQQKQAGKSFGLSFVLNPALNEYFCTSSDSTGFRMSTHLSIDSSHVTDFGISIRPQAEVFVSLRPEITLVDPTIFKFPIETRNCYRLEEYSLKYYKYYTISNCIDECIANETLNTCGCKRYYMPRDESELLCGANVTGFSCAEEVKYNLSKVGSKNSCKMCLASCNEIEYQSQTTTTPLKKNIWMNNLNEQSPWANENVSIVHVFFGQDAVYPRVRKELFGSTDLFANTGGLMGLCLGFSGLSLMEVVYFLTLRAWWCYRRKQNENDLKKSEVPQADLSKGPSPTTSPKHKNQLEYEDITNPKFNDNETLKVVTKRMNRENNSIPKPIKVIHELPRVAIDDAKEFSVELPVIKKLNDSLKPSVPQSYKSILGDL